MENLKLIIYLLLMIKTTKTKRGEKMIKKTKKQVKPRIDIILFMSMIRNKKNTDAELLQLAQDYRNKKFIIE